MKQLILFSLLLISCEKEKAECFCRQKLYKMGVFNSGDPNDEMNGTPMATFKGYAPYYREDCNKQNKWYDLDSTTKYFLVCDL